LNAFEEWGDLLTEQELLALRRAGYGERGSHAWGRRPFGSRPALIVIDVQRQTVGPDAPIDEAVLAYPTAVGTVAHRTLERIVELVAVARRADVPIIFTRLVPPAADADDEPYALVPELQPRTSELLIDKPFASAFFDTDLHGHLTELRVDTVVLVGTSTSGCVRATGVDAQQRGYSMVVVRDCTFDRVSISHRVALFDIALKYGLVEDASTVGARLAAASASPRAGG
jgi:nicotinamidase-related amidase